MANKITLNMLIRHHACQAYRDKFTEMFPDGTALVTVDLAVRMATEFPWSWAADNLLTSQNITAWYETYRVADEINIEIIQQAREVREAACADDHDAAWEVYRQVREQADRDFCVASATKFAELFLAQPETTGRDDYLGILNDYPVCDLASMAGTSGPDHDGSPGAKFLDDLRDLASEAIKSGASPDTLRDESGSLANQAAENAESRSTYHKWLAFADLCAFEEDLSEFEPLENMTQGRDRALWVIADRLIHAIADEYKGHYEDTDSDDEDEDH